MVRMGNWEAMGKVILFERLAPTFSGFILGGVEGFVEFMRREDLSRRVRHG